MTKTFQFGKIAFVSNRKVNPVEVTVALRKKDEGEVLSICASVFNSKCTDIVCGGQCLDSLEPFFKDNALFMELLDLWRNYHLNDMHAGTEKQEAEVDRWLKETGEKYDYARVSKHLEEVGLLVDNGYTYGHGWLFRSIPEEKLNRIKELIG